MKEEVKKKKEEEEEKKKKEEEEEEEREGVTRRRRGRPGGRSLLWAGASALPPHLGALPPPKEIFLKNSEKERVLCLLQKEKIS